MKKFLLILLFLFLTCLPTYAQYGPQSVKPMLGQQINWANPITRGLVGCWEFNEGSGNKVYDLSGNGNTGTVTNALWTPGKFGSCLSFDGSGDYVALPYLNIGTSITYSIWFRTQQVDDYQTLLAYMKTRLRFYCVAGYNYVFWNPNTGGGDSFVGYTFDVGTWYHIAVTQTGSSFVIYVNGRVIQSDIANAVSTDNVNNYIGTADGSLYYFKGGIEDVMIFKRALSPSEIRELYYKPFGMFYDTDIWWLYTAPITGGGQVIFVNFN